MKYKVGDRVRIKSLDWYNNNKDEDGYVDLRLCTQSRHSLHPDMSVFCGKIVTITSISEYKHAYEIKEDNGDFYWTDEMIECKVEEETKPKYEDEVTGEYYSTPKYLVRPNGYQFVDENDNVINATKIVLKKKKKEYPKTYEECCEILGCKANDFFTDFSYNNRDVEISDYEDKVDDLLQNFRKLRYCRDAYWKLYGEEMGLGKPWEPDWENSEERRYCIVNINGEINLPEKILTKWILKVTNKILVFPTEEMRDAFYENFKKEIEICKELL